DLAVLLRNPGLLARSILAMNIVMPIFAVVLARLFSLDPAIEIALVALALSPVPPALPGKQMKAGGTEAYSLGLLVAAAAAAIILVPVGMEALELVFPLDLHVPPGEVAAIVAASIFVPLFAGMAIAKFAPDFAERVAPLISRIALIVVLVAIIPALIKAW